MPQTSTCAPASRRRSPAEKMPAGAPGQDRVSSEKFWATSSRLWVTIATRARGFSSRVSRARAAITSALPAPVGRTIRWPGAASSAPPRAQAAESASRLARW